MFPTLGETPCQVTIQHSSHSLKLLKLEEYLVHLKLKRLKAKMKLTVPIVQKISELVS